MTVEGVIDKIEKNESRKFSVIFENGVKFSSVSNRAYLYGCMRSYLFKPDGYEINGNVRQIQKGDYIKIDYTHNIGNIKTAENRPCVLNIYLKSDNENNV